MCIRDRLYGIYYSVKQTKNPYYFFGCSLTFYFMQGIVSGLERKDAQNTFDKFFKKYKDKHPLSLNYYPNGRKIEVAYGIVFGKSKGK